MARALLYFSITSIVVGCAGSGGVTLPARHGPFDRSPRGDSEAAAIERNNVRLPVDDVRVGAGSAERQLVLWRLEVERNPAARGEFARLVSRILAARDDPAMLSLCAEYCVVHGCAHVVLPYLDAYVDNPRDYELEPVRRWAIRIADPARLPAVLEEDGILGDGEEAAHMLHQVEDYSFGEEAWQIHQQLPTADMQPASGSLPMETLYETLVALVDDSQARWMEELHIRVDVETDAQEIEDGAPDPEALVAEPSVPDAVRPDPSDPSATWLAANPPLRLVTWSDARARHQVWLVPLARDISEAGESWRRIRGRVTLTVGVHDTGSPLSIRGRVDGEHFRLEASSAPFDWSVVNRLVSAALPDFPLARYARNSRAATPGQYRAQVTDVERRAIEARASGPLRCTAADGGTLTCELPSDRLIARRTIMHVLRPLLFE